MHLRENSNSNSKGGKNMLFLKKQVIMESQPITKSNRREYTTKWMNA